MKVGALAQGNAHHQDERSSGQYEHAGRHHAVRPQVAQAQASPIQLLSSKGD